MRLVRSHFKSTFAYTLLTAHMTLTFMTLFIINLFRFELSEVRVSYTSIEKKTLASKQCRQLCIEGD